MALIQCPECSTQISDKASACIKCGAPIAATTQVAPQVITTQQTGKQYKVGKIIGSTMVILGMASCASNEIGTASTLFILGGIVYFGSVFGAWWSHG